jgi:hypothetical protein
MSTFVCVDGEGLDTKRDTRTHRWNRVDSLTGEKSSGTYTSNEHIYTFMASSSGNCIRAWEDGLSTYECFEFVLAEKKKDTIMVGFSFGYDSCMMFRDISSESLELLWSDGVCYYYSHGNVYKVDYFPGKWLSVSKITRVDGKVRVLQSAKIWDVFGFFQHSFVASLDEWLADKIEDKEILDTIRHMKEQRGNFAQESQEEIERYCFKECELLRMLMTQLRATLEAANIHLRQWHGAGAISGYLFSQNHIERHVHWDDIPELAQDVALRSYYGGRIELFQQGFFEPPVYEYDVTGAYPGSIVGLPSLRRGTWYGTVGGEVNVRNPLCMYGMWLCEWDVSQSVQSWLAPFPQRARDGAIYWAQRGRGWYHTSEALAALNVFGCSISVEKGVYLIPNDWNEKPFAWLAELMERRIEYKKNGDPRHIVLKLGGNSGYGKLAQGTSRLATLGRKLPRFQNYYLAGYVTASCRSKVLAAVSCFNREDVICTATDGIYTRALCDGIEDTLGVLGSWSLKPAKTERVFFGQAGVMFTPTGREVKTRGFRKTSFSYDDCVTTWNNVSGDWALFRREYKERRFVGLGYSASTGHWDEFRRWVDRDRDFTLRTEPRKVHEDVNEGEAFFFLSPGEAPSENMPYRPKGELVKETQQYDGELLELVERVEQPEYSDS